MHSLERAITPGYLLRFTIPTMVMLIFNSFYTMVDGAFVSNFVGTGALSATNIVYPALNLVFAVGIMLATGGSAIVGRQLGEGKGQQARENFSLVVSAGTVLGFVIAVLGVVFASPLVRMLGANDAIYSYCYDYLIYMSVFSPCAVLQMLFQYLFVTAGRPNLGLVSTVAGGVANIVLDYVFIVPMQMGIKGAALATGVGFTIPAVTGLIYFSIARKESLHFTKPVFRGKILVEACTNGSSEMVTNLAIAVTTFLFNVEMMRWLGEDGVAAITIVFYADFLFVAMFLGYTSGVAPLFSYNYGAGNHERLQRLFRLSLLFIGIGSVAAYAASMLFSGPVVALFADGQSSVYSIALHGMRLYALSFLLKGVNIFSSGLFTALSNGKVSAFLSFLRTFGFLVLCIFLLPKLWGVNGIWLAIPVAEILSLAVSGWCLFRFRSVYHYA
ncbi:MATE family efflux transporter [uncultured Ruthenibacterium sp.]|uniref:MATE family efflux transporter n=1 Tax=uncultured Ruthenibacterium sp. TaxID=1905347 RepID=UPI00349EF9B0